MRVVVGRRLRRQRRLRLGGGEARAPRARLDGASWPSEVDCQAHRGDDFEPRRPCGDDDGGAADDARRPAAAVLLPRAAARRARVVAEFRRSSELGVPELDGGRACSATSRSTRGEGVSLLWWNDGVDDRWNDGLTDDDVLRWNYRPRDGPREVER